MIPPDDVTAAFVPRLRDEVAVVPVAEEAVLYVESDGQLVQLDAIGALTVEFVDGQTSIADASRELAEGFGADLDTVQADVLAFVQRLGRLGLLEGVEGTEPVDALPDQA